jgi:putative transposase
VTYKTELVGLEVETVNPPDDHTEQRHGGQFHCPACDYECDRDVVGAVNVGRTYLDGGKMEEANPAAYTEAGNHASFPSPSGARSAGVQSATDQQEMASGRQTQLSQYCSSSLTAKRRETDTGGLHRNYGSHTGQQLSSGSLTQYVLASTTECG